MLEAGGMPIMTDHIRKADEDNLRGYYEYEKVKTIQQDVTWLDLCHGHALKMVSALLYHLPAHKDYFIIFMTRDMAEMLASQQKMLERRGTPPGADNNELSHKLEKHLITIRAWLSRQENMKTLEVNFNDAIRKPFDTADAVNRFLDGILSVDKMVKAIEPALYRQKSERTGGE
jgi:hypothetical protein